MAFAKRFPIKESLGELRQALQQTPSELARMRLRTLIIYKKHEPTGISVREVVRLTGIDRGSAMNWRNAYIKGGMDGLIAHRRGGNHASVITAGECEMLRAKLHDAQNGLRGYKELVVWFNEHFGSEVKYHTMNQFVKRKFGALSKVARKSHVRKDPQSAMAFKKTSRRSVRI